MTRVIAIIPARGGSKRFPLKNVHPLRGKPLISYPIEAAKEAKFIERVIVSTDNEEIARAAREYGAEVPFLRPAEIAGDVSPVIEALQFTLMELERTEHYRPDFVVLLQPTTPLVTSAQIDTAISLAIEKQADSVTNVSLLDTISHPYNIRTIESDGTTHFWKEDLHYSCIGKNRPVFYKAANLWLSSYDTITMSGKLEGKRNYPIVVPDIYSSDIDYKEDLERIEIFLNAGIV